MTSDIPAPFVNNTTSWEMIYCPVCGSESFTRLFQKQNEIFVRCESCMLVLINPRPIYNQGLSTYDHDYSEHYAIKSGKKLRRCRRWVNRVRRRYGLGGRWLDIGCSVGFVVVAAEEAGFEGYGIDIEPWGLEYGRKNFHLQNLSQGMLEKQHYPDHYFKVISLYDVIEHVPDLNILVAEIKRILTPGGVIDIITPDISHWRVPGLLENWKEIKPSEHLYYFNQHILSRLLQKHGLKIVKKRFNIKPALRVYVQHSG